MKDDKLMKIELESFFKECFCANSANLLDSTKIHEFKVNGIFEIDCGDQRGLIHIAVLTDE